MKPVTQLSAKVNIGHAADCVRQALDTFDATDLKGVANAQELLERAVEDLKRATEALGPNTAEKPRELRPLVDAVKRDVSRMTQVVDACSAFQNGLAVRLGGSAVAYDSSGSVPVPADGVNSRGFEV
jgi:hypothetical protein